MTRSCLALAGLLPLVLACPRKSTPTPEDGPDEPGLRKTCQEGDLFGCYQLGAALVSGALGDGRKQEGYTTLRQACAEGGMDSCILSALAVRRFPQELPATEEPALMGDLCERGFFFACKELATAASGDPSRTWREKGCAAGDQGACALLGGSWPQDPAPQEPLPEPFIQSLAAARMSFQTPPGFTAVAPTDNPHLAWQHGIRAQDGSIEIRYRVDPIAPLMAEKARCDADPNCVMADPNAVGPTMAFASALNMGGGRVADQGSFPKPSVFLEFNADDANLWAFPPMQDFAPGWDMGLLIALHRDDQGDALIILLLKEGVAMDPAWSVAFHALRFTDPWWPKGGT